jgi:hypothetical protein
MTTRPHIKRAISDDYVELDIPSDDTYGMSEDNISDDDSYCGDREESFSRMSSPKAALDLPIILEGTRKRKASQHAQQQQSYDDDEMAEKRVTIWNWREQRKLSGNSAPFKKNLQDYLRKHPDWEEYVGQDKDENGKKYSQHSTQKKRKINEPIRKEPVRPPALSARQESVLANAEAAARRREAAEVQRQMAAQEAEDAWHRAKDAAMKQKEQEEKEANRWRESSTIQHIIDHYNQGPWKSPFVGDNAMMNA